MYQVKLSGKEMYTVTAVLAGRVAVLRQPALINGKLVQPGEGDLEYASRIEVAFNKLCDAEGDNPSEMTDEQIAKTCSVMRAYGGHFCQHIADMYGVADSSNRVTLLHAFDHLFVKYGPVSDFYKGYA